MKVVPDLVGYYRALTPGVVLGFMRHAYGLTHEQVATCAGVCPIVLQRVEQGARNVPSPVWGGVVMDAIMRLGERGEHP